jgi:hypothetical protein
MPPPRVVVVVAAPPPVAAAAPVVVVVPVPLIVAVSRLVAVVVVVVSVVPHEVKKRAHSATAGLRIVIFFIANLSVVSGPGLLPDYRVVVDCVVVVVAAGRVVTADSRTTVVEVGAGVSTTVVQELNREAASATGRRMMNFFIVGVVVFNPQFGPRLLVSRIVG